MKDSNKSYSVKLLAHYEIKKVEIIDFSYVHGGIIFEIVFDLSFNSIIKKPHTCVTQIVINDMWLSSMETALHKEIKTNIEEDRYISYFEDDEEEHDLDS